LRKILIIDNYDSFVYNLYQYFGEVDPSAELIVYRNDKITIKEIHELNPSHILISPGPGRPEDAGVCTAVIKEFAGKIPIFGVCLGHQAIGFVFGAKIIHAKKVVHGKVSKITHDLSGLFVGVSSPLNVTRYHSLVIDSESVPECLIVTAKTDDGEIMAVKHKDYAVYGVQFHPESILTQEGKKIISNFLGANFIPKKKELADFTLIAALEKLSSKCDLDIEEAKIAMRYIMEGKASDAEVASFLTGLRIKGESAEELSAMALVMKEFSTKVEFNGLDPVDTCGTGGDGAGTFNISTATAIVISAAGVPVAKHGNRSASSKVGSADVLEAMGYKFNKTNEQIKDEMNKTNFCFMFAPVYHPAMKHVSAARKAIKIRTAFNLLGPIVNPASTKHQLIGVFDFSYAHKMARALQVLGTKKSLIVNGTFTDELTVCSDNYAVLVTPTEIKSLKIDLEDLGLKKGLIEDLKGADDAVSGLKIIEDIFESKVESSKFNTIILNAGVMFWLCGETSSIKEGVRLAKEVILSGQALEQFKKIKEYNKNA